MKYLRRCPHPPCPANIEQRFISSRPTQIVSFAGSSAISCPGRGRKCLWLEQQAESEKLWRFVALKPDPPSLWVAGERTSLRALYRSTAMARPVLCHSISRKLTRYRTLQQSSYQELLVPKSWHHDNIVQHHQNASWSGLCYFQFGDSTRNWFYKARDYWYRQCSDGIDDKLFKLFRSDQGVSAIFAGQERRIFFDIVCPPTSY